MLRNALRTDLSDAHLRVDRLFSCFELTTPMGLTGFCRANENALRVLRFPQDGGEADVQSAGQTAGQSAGQTAGPVAGQAAGQAGSTSNPTPADGPPHYIDAAPMIAALHADRLVLGDSAPLPPLPGLDTAPHDIAVAYILLGSRLGTQVLRRDWARSDVPRVQSAERYFTLPPLTAQWRALVADLDTRHADCPDAQRILQDAEAIFDLFARSAQLELARLIPA